MSEIPAQENTGIEEPISRNGESAFVPDKNGVKTPFIEEEEEMQILELGCEQFAGIRDQKVEFKKGLNILIGENESGKSTLVDLIYRLFFQKVKVDMRSESYKDPESVKLSVFI